MKKVITILSGVALGGMLLLATGNAGAWWGNGWGGPWGGGPWYGGYPYYGYGGPWGYGGGPYGWGGGPYGWGGPYGGYGHPYGLGVPAWGAYPVPAVVAPSTTGADK